MASLVVSVNVAGETAVSRRMLGTDIVWFPLVAGAVELAGGDRKPRVRFSVEGSVEGAVAGASPAGDEVVGLNFTPGAGIVVIGEAVRLLVGLAAITAGSRGLGAVVENVGFAVALPLAAGAASTMRIGSSAEAVGCVEKEDVAGAGADWIGEAAAGVALISLRIVPPAVAGFVVASGSVTIGGNVLAESVGVAGGG